MKRLVLLIVGIIITTSVLQAEVIYLDPIPDSKYVNTENNLIIGLSNPITQNTLNGLSITVVGSKSGIHNGSITLTADKKKILWNHDRPFSLDETVTVSISSDSNVIEYNSQKNFTYSFQTQKAKIEWNYEKTLRSELGEYYNPPFLIDNPTVPKLEVTQSNNPSPGKLFLANFYNTESFLIIAENNGDIVFSRPLIYEGVDFKKQPNGTLTYHETKRSKFFQLNDRYELIDSFECGNGYATDLHELIILPNGHALIMSYDAQAVDMSQIVNGGQHDATVTGLVIQELDEDKDVVFQWRSWDHFEITDAWHEDLTALHIDYVHGNAIEPDSDGNILISSRHLDEITKINRNTGEVIWRLGGKNNQFTFINDSLKFNYQHDIRRLSNGNVSLYDNGNHHPVPESRAVEYQLDEVNKIATLVWEYKNTPSIYGFAMGSAQRLENGNTLIGWGFTSPTLTEVTPEGNIALEVKLPQGMVSYRCFKFEWDGSVSIQNGNGNTPSSYSLNQNYPNPFNPATSISFSIPRSGNVSIKVYDIMGREVAALLNENLNAGNHEINFNAVNLASGVYIYKMEADNFSVSKKMILMK